MLCVTEGEKLTKAAAHGQVLLTKMSVWRLAEKWIWRARSADYCRAIYCRGGGDEHNTGTTGALIITTTHDHAYLNLIIFPSPQCLALPGACMLPTNHANLFLASPPLTNIQCAERRVLIKKAHVQSGQPIIVEPPIVRATRASPSDDLGDANSGDKPCHCITPRWEHFLLT